MIALVRRSIIFAAWSFLTNVKADSAAANSKSYFDTTLPNVDSGNSGTLLRREPKYHITATAPPIDAATHQILAENDRLKLLIDQQRLRNELAELTPLSPDIRNDTSLRSAASIDELLQLSGDPKRTQRVEQRPEARPEGWQHLSQEEEEDDDEDDDGDDRSEARSQQQRRSQKKGRSARQMIEEDDEQQSGGTMQQRNSRPSKFSHSGHNRDRRHFDGEDGSRGGNRKWPEDDQVARRDKGHKALSEMSENEPGRRSQRKVDTRPSKHTRKVRGRGSLSKSPTQVRDAIRPEEEEAASLDQDAAAGVEGVDSPGDAGEMIDDGDAVLTEEEVISDHSDGSSDYDTHDDVIDGALYQSDESDGSAEDSDGGDNADEDAADEEELLDEVDDESDSLSSETSAEGESDYASLSQLQAAALLERAAKIDDATSADKDPAPARVPTTKPVCKEKMGWNCASACKKENEKWHGITNTCCNWCGNGNACCQMTAGHANGTVCATEYENWAKKSNVNEDNWVKNITHHQCVQVTGNAGKTCPMSGKDQDCTT
jgi:hypothetical protein